MSPRAERRHPETLPVDPAVCEPSRAPSSADMGARGRVGGYARAAGMSDAELSAQMKRVRAARTEKENARRIAAGLSPITPKPPLLDGDSLIYWLSVVDERYPDRIFENRMQRRRLAERLARMEAARLAAEAFRRREVDGDA